MKSYGCVVGVLATAAGVCLAGNIQLEAKVGLGGFARQGCCAPVRVVIRNLGPDTRGILTVSQILWGRAVERYKFPVVLPGGAEVVKQVITPLHRSGYNQTRVQFRPESGRTVTASPPSAGILRYERFVAVVGPRETMRGVSGYTAAPWAMSPFAREGLIVSTVGGGAGMPGMAGPLPGPISFNIRTTTRLVELGPKDAPADWQGYESADCVVVRGALVGRLSAAQRAALARWTAAGGWLIVTGGAALEPGHDRQLAPLLPGTVTGLTSLPRATALARRYGGDALRDLPILTVAPGSAAVLLKQGGHPLITAGSYGLGTVEFLAFDPLSPPFRAWGGAKALWREVLRLDKARGQIVSLPSRSVTAPVTALPKDPAEQSASLLSVLSFLCVYFLLAIPVNRIVLRRLGKPEWMWVTAPAIAGLFTYGSFAFARGLKGQHIVLVRRTLRLSGPRAPQALDCEAFTLFSPAIRAYEVGLPTGVRTLTDLTESNRQEWQRRFGFVFCPVEPPVLEGMAVGMWATRKFAFCRVADPGPGLKCSLQTVSGDEVRGTMRNETSHALRGCCFFLGRAAVSVGTLAPGQSRRFRLKVGSPPLTLESALARLPDPGGQFTGPSLEDRWMNQRVRSWTRGPWFTELQDYRTWLAGAWAVGVSERALAALDVKGRRPRKTTAVMLASRPDLITQDGHVVAPPDRCGVRLVSASSGLTFSRYGPGDETPVVVVRSGRLVVDLAPPVETTGARWSRGVMYVWLLSRPASEPLACSGYDFHKKKWIPLGNFSPGRHAQRQIPQVQRFVNPATGMVRLAVACKLPVTIQDVRLLLLGKRPR